MHRETCTHSLCVLFLQRYIVVYAKLSSLCKIIQNDLNETVIGVAKYILKSS